MNSTEMNKINRLIGELDTANGMLIFAAMKDETVKAAMQKVVEVSFELGLMLE